jgi:enediyne biosynthesis thioesterase
VFHRLEKQNGQRHKPGHNIAGNSSMQTSTNMLNGQTRVLPAYEYRHVVTFEETNLVGNVYYVNHLRWQGCCREMFLREYAPETLRALQNDLCLVTAHCACDYLAELTAFTEVLLRMRLKQIVQNRIEFDFEYWRCEEGREDLVATGEQEVVCMRRSGAGLVPVAIPEQLLAALQPFASV